MTPGDDPGSSTPTSPVGSGVATTIAEYDAFRVDLHRDGLRIVSRIAAITTGLRWVLWAAFAGLVFSAVRSLRDGLSWGSVLWCAATLPVGACVLLVAAALRQVGARASENDDLLHAIAATDKARLPGEEWPGQHEFHADASMLLAHVDMAFPDGSPPRGDPQPRPTGIDLLSALTLLDSVGAHGLAFHEKWLAPELVARMQASAGTPDA